MLVLTSCSSYKKVEIEGVDGHFIIPKKRILGQIAWDLNPRLKSSSIVFQKCKDKIRNQKAEENCIVPNYLISGRISKSHMNNTNEIYEKQIYDTKNSKKGDLVWVYTDNDKFDGVFIKEVNSADGVYSVLVASCKNSKHRTLRKCRRDYHGINYTISYSFKFENIEDLYFEEVYEKMDGEVFDLVNSWYVN